MDILSVKDLELSGKRVLMRVDFNVPMNSEGKITDDTRILLTLPTIQYILDQGASLVLMSHLGKPKGKEVASMSLKAAAVRLEELLNRPVIFSPKEEEKLCSLLLPGQIILLENLRFNPAEENPKSDPGFSKKLATFGDFFVQDAFGSVHRPHASIVDVPEEFPGKVASGFLLEKELEAIEVLMKSPKRPLYALIGGAKISSKLGVLNALIDKVDGLFLGGGMVYTFMKALGLPIGRSIFEEDQIENAKAIIEKCKKKRVALHLPIDIVVADAIDSKANIKTVLLKEGILAPFEGVDIGPKTVDLYREELKSGKTFFWNGPFGVFEVAPFNRGTQEIAKILAECHDKGAIVVVGGGDSVAAVNNTGLGSRMTHLSTGGGATLEYIEKGTLPGIEMLTVKA